MATSPINASATSLGLPKGLVLFGLGLLLLFVFIAGFWNSVDTVAPWPQQVLVWAGIAVAALGVVFLSQALVNAQGFLGLVPALLVLLLSVVATEALVRANNVPAAFLPRPSAVAETFWGSAAVLRRDAWFTFLEAFVGYVAGAVLGVVLAVLVSRFVFLEAGLMPYAALFGSIPIVALAPVVIKAVGIEWFSKSVVVAFTVVFPVLVNVARGLQEVSPTTLDLMRSYGASEQQTFWSVRVPSALPFLFNALKIGTTLAMIGAIVGEFFGATGVGLGFRIVTGSGISDLAIVWSAIVYASVLGIVWYNLTNLLERRLMGWHVSFREP